jgi:hypothetical protein
MKNRKSQIILVKEQTLCKRSYIKTWNPECFKDHFLFKDLDYSVSNLKVKGTTIFFSLYDDQGFIGNYIVDNVVLVSCTDGSMILFPSK